MQHTCGWHGSMGVIGFTLGLTWRKCHTVLAVAGTMAVHGVEFHYDQQIADREMHFEQAGHDDCTFLRNILVPKDLTCFGHICSVVSKFIGLFDTLITWTNKMYSYNVAIAGFLGGCFVLGLSFSHVVGQFALKGWPLAHAGVSRACVTCASTNIIYIYCIYIYIIYVYMHQALPPPPPCPVVRWAPPPVVWWGCGAVPLPHPHLWHVWKVWYVWYAW